MPPSSYIELRNRGRKSNFCSNVASVFKIWYHLSVLSFVEFDSIKCVVCSLVLNNDISKIESLELEIFK